jgi:hypothetical protein
MRSDTCAWLHDCTGTHNRSDIQANRRVNECGGMDSNSPIQIESTSYSTPHIIVADRNDRVMFSKLRCAANLAQDRNAEDTHVVKVGIIVDDRVHGTSGGLKN